MSEDTDNDGPTIEEQAAEAVRRLEGSRQSMAAKYGEDGPPPLHLVEPDYSKPYSDMDYMERRKILLDRIEQVAHPRALPQTYEDLAGEFDVSTATIHRDMKRIAEYQAEHVDREHVSIMDTVFRGAVRELVKDDKYVEASDVGYKWFEWLADMGAIERVPDKLAVDQRVRHETLETEDYQIIPDDEADAIDADYVEVPNE